MGMSAEDLTDRDQLWLKQAQLARIKALGMQDRLPAIDPDHARTKRNRGRTVQPRARF